MEKYHIPVHSADTGPVGAAIVQCGRPDLYRSFTGGGQYGADRDRSSLSSYNNYRSIYKPFRNRRSPSVFHSKRGPAGETGGKNSGQYLFSFSVLFCRAYGAVFCVSKACPVSVWGKRRFLCICGRLSENLSSGNSFCHACHRVKRFYQCSGVSKNGDDDNAFGGGAEFDFGSHFYFQFTYGSERGRSCHHTEPDGLLYLGFAFSYNAATFGKRNTASD